MRELHRREIDRDLVRLAPSDAACLQAARSTHSPIGRIDPVLLGNRNEPQRRDHAALGVAPAQQHLVAADLAGRDRGLHLVVQLELTALDRMAQVVGEAAAVARRFVELVLVETHGAADLDLGAIHREIGIADQRLARCAILGIDRNADAGAEVEVKSVDLDRLEQRRLEAADEIEQIVLVGKALDCAEFVAADARGELVLAERRGKPLADDAAAPGRRRCGRAGR